MARGSSVYVGNIDFEVPEQRVIEELSKIGKVVNFRMMIDRQTGKSKGYGFCEYESPLIAETAVQKLKITLNNRQLKINYADIDAKPQKKETEIPIDNFINILNQMDKTNLKEVMLYLKKMAVDQPRKLKSLLDENKNLGVAIFHCMIELNLIEEDVVYDLLKKHFEIDDHKVDIIARICQLTEDEVSNYDEDTKEKILQVRNRLMKKDK